MCTFQVSKRSAEEDSPPQQPSMRRNVSASSISSNMISRKPDISKVLRLKIRILEHMLLVPVDENQMEETISWLCNECSTRYMR